MEMCGLILPLRHMMKEVKELIQSSDDGKKNLSLLHSKDGEKRWNIIFSVPYIKQIISLHAYQCYQVRAGFAEPPLLKMERAATCKL